MGLKISLKPKERMIIGGAVVANGSGKSEFLIENTVPVLREKDILSEREADTPCKRIYFSIQLMYIDEKKLTEYHQSYWALVREVVAAAPSTLGLIDRISEQILGGRYYQALKLAKSLVEYEQEVVNNVRKPDGNLQKRPENDDVRPGDRGLGPYQGRPEAQVLPGPLGRGGPR